MLALAAIAAAMPARADVPRSLSAYVKARAADADGAVELAASAYADALAAAPGNPVVAIRAYREALQAGDWPLVRTSVMTLEAAGVAPADTAITTAADAIARRDWAAAMAASDRFAGGPLDFLAPVLKAWITFDRGDRAAAALLDDSHGGALARRFGAESRALLLIAGDRPDDGVAALRSLIGAEPGNLELRVNAAPLLVAAGRGDVARALLTGNDRVLSALRQRLGEGRRADAAFGVSRLFTRLAADLVRGEARVLAIVLARSALRLDPGDDRARLILADALAADGAPARALALLEAVPATSIYASTALAAKVSVLTRAGQARRALDTAHAVAIADGADSADAQRHGDLLVAAGRFDDAAAAYATAMARAGDRAGWVLFLQRGGALEQAGRWPEARAMLERAVALAPEPAAALNYLGYAELERGGDLAVARTLLEQAAKLEPDDAAIADSLGWAYVASGMVARVLPLIERAARAQPGDVTIQEHLGDAYWRAGRRYEARYAWRAASVQAASSDARRLSGKLQSGLR